MKNYNSYLAYLIVKEYAAILYRQVKSYAITADEMSRELGRYMRKVGLPKQIIVLAVCAYIALL